jgi:hypothetical protein
VTADEKRIVALLCGRLSRDRRGLPHAIYMKHYSAEEIEARRALARMLRTSLPLDSGVRFVLGDLFDPDLDDVERTIRFEHRRKGKRSNALAEKEIAEFVWLQAQNGARIKGARIKTAVGNAAKKFGIGDDRVRAIWKQWRPRLERLKGHDLRGRPVKPFW